MKIFLFILLILFPAADAKLKAKYRYPTGPCEDCGFTTLTSSRLSNEQLKRFAKYDPDNDEARKDFLPQLLLCIEGDPAYSNCSRREVTFPNIARIAAMNLKKGEATLKTIQTDLADAPEDLKPVIEFYLRQFKYDLALLRYEYEFIESQNTAKLENPVENIQIDPQLLSKVMAPQTPESQLEVVSYDIHNFFNDKIRKKVGTLTPAQLKRFFKLIQKKTDGAEKNCCD
jgi:hypothetical protein